MRIVGCFLEYDGKFAILLRHSHKPNGNTWGLPAGKVEEGEHDKAAALRELREETGFVAHESQLEHLGDYTFGQPNSTYTFATYRIKLADPHEIIVEDAAHAETKWVSADECYALPNLIPDFHELLQLVGYIKPEEPLTSNETHPIIRINNEVHRPTEFWTPAVHDLLQYLESVEFPYSPRVIGTDSKGREVLSYIDGESGKAGWKKIISDEGLIKYAKFLRTYHDAVKGYVPSAGLEWANGATSMTKEQIICHGDFGPWNIVWKGDDPIGIVDWDLLHPNKPDYDILYCLEYSAPFRDNEIAIKWHAFSEAPNRKRRIQIFLEAYGTEPIDNITIKVAQMQREVGKFEEYLAKRGIQPQADWVANGDLVEVERRAKWTEQSLPLVS